MIEEFEGVILSSSRKSSSLGEIYDLFTSLLLKTTNNFRKGFKIITKIPWYKLKSE